jgi:hypothetical protein
MDYREVGGKPTKIGFGTEYLPGRYIIFELLKVCLSYPPNYNYTPLLPME